MHQIKVSDFTIDVVRKDIKNMHLAVYPPSGRVRIAAPLRIDDEAVKLFAISKLAWIKRNQRNFDKQERQSPREFIDRESHYFLGKRYLLRVKEIDEAPKVVLTSKTYIDLYVRPETPPEKRSAILNEWYRSELKNISQALIKKWEKTIGVSIEEWGVKQMKTKWGTCNIEARRIWLNLELAKKAPHCIEFIVVHELIHLLERHHNDKFLAFIDKFLPQWKSYRDDLNRLPYSHADWDY